MLKGRTPLVLAVVLAAIAGFLAYVSLVSSEKAVRAGWELVPAVVANEDLEAGTEVDVDNIAVRKVPEDFVTKSVIRPENVQHILGQRLAVDIKRGDLLLWSHFQESREFERLSTLVQPKYRAISIKVNEESSVSQWIRPNDHVDVLGTFRDPQNNQMMTVTLLQNVIVLATGKIAPTTTTTGLPREERMYPSITLLVLPEEAEILTLAQEMGNLYATLRNPDDISVQRERGKATLKTLLTGERLNTLGRIRQKDQVIIIRGTQAKKAGGLGGD